MTIPAPAPGNGAPRAVQTVLGPVPFDALGVTDAHNHVWIEPVAGSDPASPTLTQVDGILAELIEYRESGGGAILDCQPGGCGRNGNQLAELSRASGVRILACTGFHRRKYYAPDFWLWELDADAAARHFAAELQQNLAETRPGPGQVKAGFIKVAIEASLAETPRAALEGAARAAVVTGTVLETHTEKGAAAWEVVEYFQRAGVRPGQIVLCHMDKRPDFGLHADLARAGVLLEYDTFYRARYDPEKNLWPLIDRMAAANLGQQVALATDMAEAGMYRNLGCGPGLASLPGQIRARLVERGIPNQVVRQMLGENIARRLAGLA